MKPEPKHSKGWTSVTKLVDAVDGRLPSAPGKHHPARPVTYDKAGATTPLNPPTNVLDVAA